MASLSLSLFILASLTAISADSRNKQGYQLLRLPERNDIQAAFELVRDHFKTTPFPGMGYLDPLYIETYRIKLNVDDMNGYADLSATTIKDLLGFKVTNVKISPNLQRIQFDFLFPEISASGKYEILPTSQQDDIYGNGEFVVTARNLRIHINTYMGKTIDGDIFCEKMESELSLEASDATVTGLYDDELSSEAFSLRLSENLFDYVPGIKDAIDAFLELYAERVNAKFNSMRFSKHEL